MPLGVTPLGHMSQGVTRLGHMSLIHVYQLTVTVNSHSIS